MRTFLAFILIGIARIAIAADMTSEDRAATDQAAAVAKAAATATDPDPSQLVQDQMDVYVRQSGFQVREQAGELKIVQGIGNVDVPTTNPDWISQRSIAYDEALLNGIAEYVKQQGERITNDTVRSFYQAAHQEPPPYDKNQTPGQSAELLRKILALGNAQVDSELQKLGVDPKQYAASPESQRYTQLSNTLIKKNIRQAFGDIVGLTPVKTFEGTDGKGNYSIGVVAVVSPAMREFAQQVLRAHGEFAPAPARAQDLDKVLGDQTALISQFGVRRMFDGNGLPVIVSFAQWAPAGNSDDPSVNGAYRQAAFSQAEERADGQISDFLAGSAEYSDESDTGHKMEKIAERLPDNYTQQDAVTKDVINGMMNEMRTRSNIHITGVATFRKWSIKHPVSGQPVVGVVRVWSAAGEKAMRTIRDGRSSALPAGTPPTKGTAGVTSGPDLMKPDDF
jgi:hypothetical protein